MLKLDLRKCVPSPFEIELAMLSTAVGHCNLIKSPFSCSIFVLSHTDL